MEALCLYICNGDINILWSSKNWYAIKNLKLIKPYITISQWSNVFNFVGQSHFHLVCLTSYVTLPIFILFDCACFHFLDQYPVHLLYLMQHPIPWHSQGVVYVSPSACVPEALATINRPMVFIWSGNQIFLLLKIEWANALSINSLCYKVT